MPSWLPEGNVATPGDDAQRSLIKIVDLLGGSSGGGGAALPTLTGSGPPAAGLGSVNQFYWDSTNKLLYVKDSDGWNIH